MSKLSFKVQERLANYVKQTYEEYKKLNEHRHATLLKVYRAFSTYEERRKADWQTNFKVNKAHEIIERIVPRIIAKNPRWIVEPKVEDFYKDIKLPDDPKEKKEEQKRRHELRSEYAKAIQAYLTYCFEEYKFDKPLRLAAKSMVVDGKARVKIGWKYEIERRYSKNGKKQIEEYISGEHPTVEVRSWTEILTDPRYRMVRDMPAYIEIVNAVRWADIKRNKEFFNLDKASEVFMIQAHDEDGESLIRQINSVIGINWTEDMAPDRNALTLLKFYGFFNENQNKPEDEKLVEVTLIKEIGLIIGYKEITKIPFCEADCFEDTQTNFSIGFVEPILGLTNELNFKKNSASQYINQALNRSWIWSPDSGVDPRDLISRPGNIITTTRSGPEALANIQELPQRQLQSDYFQEQNDIERQIQGQTFTVDVSSQKSQQALTDTATGMRIKFFETNSVLDEVRKHFEEMIEELAYQLLQETFEKTTENIVLKKMDADEYWEINREALRDAISRYTIKVEVNSSSFDDIESRRADSIAFFNMLLQAQQAGVQVNMEKAVIDLLETFEKRNPYDYLLPPDMAAIAEQMPGGGGKSPMKEEEIPPNESAALTEQVAGGDITSAIPA